MSRRYHVCLLALALAAASVGCGGKDVGRRPVFGAIRGAEGRAGMISFIPVGNSPLPASTTAVENGQYKFDAHNGPCSGQYSVLIKLGGPPSPSSPGKPQKRDKPEKLTPWGQRPPQAAAPADQIVQVVVPERQPWQLDLQLP